MILGVIPARLNSTRFPSKVIFPLKGKPIIEHVYDKALQSDLLSKVIVAVDSEETKNVINCQNIMMTSDKHQSGTDRVAEVANNFDCDIVVNIQGDEPGIDPLLIDQLITLFDDPNVEMASIASTDLQEDDLNNDNVVKVNLDKENNAISFVRNNLNPNLTYYRHIGIYAYRKNTLNLFTSLTQSDNEKKHRLEQLRALDNNIDINVSLAKSSPIGVDTEEDYLALKKIMEYKN